MRVGLFGGSFNPIHFGHLRAAEEVREALGLDLVYFIPAASPPHKPPDGLASAEHRLRMVQLATKGNRHFMVSDTEVRRGGRSYTIDTVRLFLSTMRPPVSLFLMMGADAFAELDTWKDADEIVRRCSLIIHTRDGVNEGGTMKQVLAAVERFGYSEADGQFVHPSEQTLSLVSTTFLPISASSIRRKSQQKVSVRYLLPADVLDYIERHGLY